MNVRMRKNSVTQYGAHNTEVISDGYEVKFFNTYAIFYRFGGSKQSNFFPLEK